MSYEHVSKRPVCHLFSQIDSAKAETAAALAICSSSAVNARLAANLDNGQKDCAGALIACRYTQCCGLGERHSTPTDPSQSTLSPRKRCGQLVMGQTRGNAACFLVHMSFARHRSVPSPEKFQERAP